MFHLFCFKLNIETSPACRDELQANNKKQKMWTTLELASTKFIYFINIMETMDFLSYFFVFDSGNPFFFFSNIICNEINYDHLCFTIKVHHVKELVVWTMEHVLCRKKTLCVNVSMVLVEEDARVGISKGLILCWRFLSDTFKYLIIGLIVPTVKSFEVYGLILQVIK